MNGNDVQRQLKEAGIDILKCMQCGMCTGSCPSGRHTSLNIRRLVKHAIKSRDVLEDKELWMCTTCYTCQERCPRRIDIVDAILKIRSIAAHEGIMLTEHRQVIKLFLEHGHAVPIDEINIKKREELGLEMLPETVHKYSDALDELKTLLKVCKLAEIIDYRL
ncbi:CoB--CoM heterodisulfide reductase subunit C [uncultured Methanomethylovorans sp.]|uniref:CoB--CoM heterodisulfide reductase subunit C n=1 Tax=uncultured Methanomethylovorans sp. TaxID=183759 RepID=UPI002AA94DC5|nr:CoB--CoM heterodisulfide reductase subunit C [uncultured Methanomethylovorans sp.]